MPFLFRIASHLPVTRGWLKQSGAKYADAARTAYAADNLDSAIANYQNALRRAPDNVDWRTDLAQVYLENNQYAEAEQSYSQVLSQDYVNLKAIKGMALTLHHQNKTDDAVYYYLRYLSLAGDDYDVLVNIGAVFHDSSRFEEAIEYSQKAAAVNPNGTEALQNLASAQYYLGQLVEAETTIRQAIKIAPTLSAYEVLGLILETQGRDDEAQESYLNAIKLDANGASAHLFLARLYGKKDQLAEYVEHCRIAVKILENSKSSADLATAYWELGWALYLTGAFQESSDVSQKSLDITPQQSSPRFNRGLALLQLTKPDEARQEYLTAMANSKPSELKRDAIDDLENALKKNPDLPGGREILDLLNAEYRKVETTRRPPPPMAQA